MALATVQEQLLNPLAYKTCLDTKNRTATERIEELLELMNERLRADEEDRMDFKHVYLVIAEPDKLEALCQAPNKYGSLDDSELGKKLQEIYMKGPDVGMFTVLAFENVMAMQSVIAKKHIDYFRHRVALQMSEDDSFTFLKRREASRLQQDGPKPISGFYLDMGNNKQATFKPYCLNDTLYQQITHIAGTLKER